MYIYAIYVANIQISKNLELVLHKIFCICKQSFSGVSLPRLASTSLVDWLAEVEEGEQAEFLFQALGRMIMKRRRTWITKATMRNMTMKSK